jgi:ferrous iron transport protein B
MNIAPLVALVGNPNAGKTSLFNALTGARQKVGNYPGVTVERKVGRWMPPGGPERGIELIDLPGTYSLDAGSPDEQVTHDVVMGRQPGERRPDAIVAVVDASNLDNHLRFVLELKELGQPMVVALNMADLARRDGLEIDVGALSRALGVDVIETVAVRRSGLDGLANAVTAALAAPSRPGPALDEAAGAIDREVHDPEAIRRRGKAGRALAAAVTVETLASRRWSRRLDRVLLNQLAGPLILAAILFVMFQAVFAWAEAPMAWIEAVIGWLQEAASAILPDNLLRSLVVDGILNGVGSVIVFLPQILILFFFILLLEQTGYMVRAAFLMDRLMARVGLSGRAFIPLLSSFACAIPGIMATRTIADPRDRLTTILIAPLMTCSARLPVYAVIIAAFIPDRSVGAGIGLQGLTLFALYFAGIIGAFLVALVLRQTVTRGSGHGFLMEMPALQSPQMRDVMLGLWQRALIFLKRAGTIILVSTVILWALLSFPRPPAGSASENPALEHSIAGRISQGLEVVFRPIGFNQEISLALIPAMAAREVAVSALGTVYSLQGDEAQVEQSLVERLRGAWSLPTALAFLAWFVFAPQCISTIAVTRRETNGWKWPLFMLGYLFGLAYLAAGATFWIATALGAG